MMTLKAQKYILDGDPLVDDHQKADRTNFQVAQAFLTCLEDMLRIMGVASVP